MPNPTEAWPSDASVQSLDGTTHASTGLPFVPKGTSPASSPTFEVQFNRFLKRLFDIVANPANRGRVVREQTTGRQYGVWPIDYEIGGTIYSYAGSTGNTATDAATTYVYLTTAGLVTNTSSFPADITTFIPLAEIVASGGDITSITDRRDRATYRAPKTTSSSDSGTNNASFIMDEDNAGAGADQQWRNNRGSTDAEDAAIEWDETNDRYNFRKQHLTNTQCPVNAEKYQIAGTDILTSSGVTKVAAAGVLATKGITQTAGVLELKTATASGTGFDGSGNISVDPSDGTVNDANGLAVALTSNGGLEFTGTVGSRTVGVKTDATTIQVNGSGQVEAKDGGLKPTKAANHDSANGGGIAIKLKATLTNGNTVSFTLPATMKVEVVDAHSVAKSADGGTWKVDNGTNDIIPAVTVTGTDKAINRAASLDDAYAQVNGGGTIRVVGDGALCDADVYIHLLRVA